MYAHIQRRGRCKNKCHGYIRIFDDGKVPFVDAYRYIFPFEFVDDGVIEITGIVDRAPTPSEGRAMLRAVKEQGWRVVRDRKEGARQGLREITRRRI